MIPKRLTLQGIYSYQKEQTIDFSTLTEAGLFGIFGSVGSGKSTILEAVSFALFGQSERLHARDNRNYNMMNLKSNELKIDFEFTSGGETYRFMVHGRRNSKKFEDVKKLDRTAYHLKNGEWESIPADSAEKITGLNYNNFHRTIIIPQGKFQEFLQLSSKDRTDMLRELFNLNKFELFGRVAEMQRNNELHLVELTTRLESIGVIDPEEIKGLEAKLKTTSEKLKQANETVATLQKQIKAEEGVREIQLKLKETKTRQTILLKEKEKIDQLEKELKEFETFSRIFRAPLERADQLTKDRNKTEKEQNSEKEELQKLRENLKKLNETFEKTRHQWSNRDKWLREAEEFEKMSTLRQLEETIKKEQERREKGTAMVEENLVVVEQLKESLKNNKKILIEKKKQLPDLKILSDIRDWFSQLKQLNKRQQETKNQLNEASKAEKDLAAQVIKITETRNITSEKPVADLIKALQDSFSTEKKQLEENKKQLEADWHSVQVQQQLQKYAHELTDGKPCPLCGSEHHPNILKAGDLSEKLSIVSEKRRKSEERHKQLTDTETQLLRLSDKLETISKDRKKFADNLEILTEQIKQHREKFQWTSFSLEKEEQVTEAFQKHEVTSNEIKKLESEQEKILSETEKAEKNKESYRKVLDEIERSIVEKKSRIETLYSQFNELKPENLTALSNDELIQKAATLRKQNSEINERYQQEEKQVAETSKKLDTLSGRIEAREKQLSEIEKEWQTIEDKINSLLEENGNLTRETVVKVVFRSFDTDGVRNQIDKHKQELSNITTSIRQYETELNGRSFDEKKHLELTNQHQQLNKKIEELNRSWGEANTTLNRMKKGQEKAKEIKKQHSKVLERAEDLKMMKNLFQGGRFVKYISTVFLQELVRAANDRFYRLTRQHLSLELASDNSFQVRDFMNEGHLRSVKTLSGGQTFQASLSLALSLADSIQKHTSASGNFFFLDEGFGTLDRESLSIVFDTLKSLRHENRIVGVISHVEEMNQEIGTFLKIDNDDEKGSLVKASWEL
ncbi:AAA family ATPase [Marinilabilia salmonicolor]|uniref:AAA family ATPase n=1 Tax=Marinilabilia salmonicolor TaxID=989 RepID=UPI000299E5DD|nr:AAA family ATPase [Marinilabilia salmonicolor]